MTTIYFLHVLLAFVTVAFLVIPGVMLEMVARTRDVTLIRRMFQIGRFHGQIGGPISLLTGIVGLVVAWRLGIPLNTGWLLATYVAFVLVNGLGASRCRIGANACGRSRRASRKCFVNRSRTGTQRLALAPLICRISAA